MIQATFISTAQAAETPAVPQVQNMFSSFLPVIVIFAIFYFLLIRPQQKQQKKTREMLGNLKKGDKVVTRGGLHGVISSIADNFITLEVADNVRMKFSRDAISAVANNTV